MKKSFIIAIIALAVLGLVAYRIIANRPAAQAARSQNLPLVRIEKPLRETVVHKLQLSGDVAAIQQAAIFARVNGNLERVLVDIGASVRRKQLLAVIDSTELHQQAQQAAATFFNAQVKHQRMEKLLAQDLVSKEDVDDAEATMKVAAANYEAARTRLSYARITAPFAGYITKRFLDPGAVVNSGNGTLFMLMDLDSVKIVVNVLEKDTPRLAKVKQAWVTVDAYPDKQYEGVVARNSEALDLATRTLAVEVDVPNKDRTLKPGMFAKVTLIIDERQEALTLPTQAILKDDRGSYVFAVENHGAKRIPISIGAEQNARTEIVSGLAGEEDIITIGQQFVKEGGQVAIQNQAPSGSD
ncbi:efflux RND transporter periplasmic adaptor subunit [candidate division KSB1 bacterium]|nr:efflux RND transporter periplasmic adaptor subunit [candidate division KSB1 bacterium]